MLYIKEKVVEILTQEPNNGGSTIPMQWSGKFNEHDAVIRFEKETAIRLNILEVLIKVFDYSKFTGGSPDGLIGNTLLLKLNAHLIFVHRDHYMLNDVVEFKEYSPAYYWQMTANILFTKRKCGDLLVMIHVLQMKNQIKRLEFAPLPGDIDLLKETIKEAEKELQVLIALIRNDFN